MLIAYIIFAIICLEFIVRIILIAEVFIIRKSFFGKLVKISLNKLKRLSYKSHPYTLYVKQPNMDGSFPSNNLGYGGKKDIEIVKPNNCLRIYCVGGSTVEEVNLKEGPNAHWPGKMQEILIKENNFNIEVINAGVAGYTSSESLSEFIFRGIDLKPDILLIYHNINDVWASQMIDGFKNDYSHCRVHRTWRVGNIHRLPKIPFIMSYQLIRGLFIRIFGGERQLMRFISNPDDWKSEEEYDYNRVKVFERNINNMIVIAKDHGILPIVLKFEHDWESDWVPNYYNKYPKKVMRKKFIKYLKENNRALKNLSKKNNCPFIKVGRFESKYFRDHLHFNSDGLDLMAKRVSERINPIINKMLST